MERTLKQITRDQFKKKPGKVRGYINKYGVWNLYTYSSSLKAYMKKTENRDSKTIKDWHKVSEETVIRHIREIL